MPTTQIEARHAPPTDRLVTAAEFAEHPEWGPEAQRGPVWEATTAVSMLLSGADILVMRHPKAVEIVRQTIYKLMEK